MGADEPPELRLLTPSALGRLPLEPPQGLQFALRLDHAFDAGDPESADQFFLEVPVTPEETGPLEILARIVNREAGLLEGARDPVFLACIVEPDHLGPTRECRQRGKEPAKGMRSADGEDLDPKRVEVNVAAPSQGFERNLVAPPFHDHDRPCADDLGKGGG